MIPWDTIVGLYDNQFKSKEDRPPINGRIVIGAVIIKHMLDLTDRETILQIQENMFMQYFLGFSSFTNEEVFDPSLFVDIRERLNLSITTAISEIIVKHHIERVPEFKTEEKNDSNTKDNDLENKTQDTHKGTLLMDATVAPQNITFPTDLKLLNASRVKSEEIIDKLYDKSIHGEVKPRTYRELARKYFLNTNKKKTKSHKEIKEANGKQLQYLKRNIAHINILIKGYEDAQKETPLKKRLKEYFEVIKLVYQQQNYMQENGVNSVENRIVNIHQAHVRPIVRGKEGVKVEFGSKHHLSLIGGFSFIDKLDWNALNESTCLKDSIKKDKERFSTRHFFKNN